MTKMTLRIPFYTGVEDLLTHLHTFQSALGCKGFNNEGQCLLFPFTLTGVALNWFYKLEPSTIDFFDELKQIFLNPFMTICTPFMQTLTIHSMTICTPFDNGMTNPYENTLLGSAMSTLGAFKSGLRSSHFRYIMHSSNLHTYDELMKQVTIHAKAKYFNSTPEPSVRQG